MVVGVGLTTLTGCNSSTYGSSSSSDDVAMITYFTLDHDSFPALEEADFDVNWCGDGLVGLIINEDSMPVGTPLTAVHPSFGFYATPSEARITISHYRDTAVTRINPDSVFTKSLTSRDTLNFDADSIFVKVVSANGQVTKIYRIVPLVHTADPNKYQWERKNANVYDVHENDVQQLMRDGETLMLYVGNTAEAPRLYTCPVAQAMQGGQWEAQPVNGLPVGCKVRQIILNSVDHQYYYGQENAIYTSSDGKSWSSQGSDRAVMATMFTFADSEGTIRPWFITKDRNSRFALTYWTAESGFKEFLSLQADSMPVSGFTVVHFQTASARSRLIVLGGMTDNGVMLRKRWSLENSEYVGTRLTDYSAEPMSFPLMLNAAAVSYGNSLLLFGAQDGDYQYIGRHVYQSSDEGMNWTLVDTTECQMPEEFKERKNVCAVVYEDKKIIVIGGSDNLKAYSDLYVGYKNEVAWKE